MITRLKDLTTLGPPPKKKNLWSFYGEKRRIQAQVFRKIRARIPAQSNASLFPQNNLNFFKMFLYIIGETINCYIEFNILIYWGGTYT